MHVEIRGPMYWYLRRWLFENRVAPAEALSRLSYHYDAGRLSREELLELLDMAPTPIPVNAPGGCA